VPDHVIAAQGEESSSNSMGRATIGQEGSDITLSPIQTRTARKKNWSSSQKKVFGPSLSRAAMLILSKHLKSCKENKQSC